MSTWVVGTCIKDRAIRLCNIMSSLYTLRNEDTDFYRAQHWLHVVSLLENYSNPLETEEAIDSLIQCRNIGHHTIDTLQEIFVSGYVEYIDDLIIEVRCEIDEDSKELESIQEDLLSIRATSKGYVV